MKNTFTNIDELILSKSFSELTPDELHSLKDVATDESGFNQIKATLFAIKKEMLASEEITPRESSKTALLAEFNKARPALNATNTSRSMGLGYFFPKGKSVIQMPGVQILSIAASILLIVTLFDFSSSNFQSTEQAYVENKSTNKETETTIELTKEKSLVSEENEISAPNEKDQNEFDAEESATITTNLEADKITDTEYNNFATDDLIADEVAMEKIEEVSKDQPFNNAEQDLYEMENADMEDEVIVDYELADNKSDADQIDGLSGSSQAGAIEPGAVDAKTTSSYANSPVRESSMALADNAIFKKESKKSKDTNTEMASRTLADDAKLIELFYTAM